MLTPFFTIDQDDEFIFISIKVSHIRFNAKNIEMIVQDELFVFSLLPYYLRLRLPRACVDDERANASYDATDECIKVKIPKAIRGETFPDLDLVSKLLSRSTVSESHSEVKEANTQVDPKAKPLIEELDVKNDVTKDQTLLEKDLEEGEHFNWEVSQTMPEQESILISDISYGFNNGYSKIVGLSLVNGNDINELGDPEGTPPSDRIIERLIKENLKFDPEYYASEYIMEKYPPADEENVYKSLLEWRSPITKLFLKWYKSQQELPDDQKELMHVEFTKKEQELMINLPRKSYIVENLYVPELMALLVTLLFAFHFDLRETEGDHNIESAWTIGKLVPQFSFLDSLLVIYNEGLSESLLKVASITCFRRALSYPLHRNFKLISKVWDDVYYNLRGGKRLVIKSLLELKELFRYHDVYYVYDKIWLEDLCSWLISDSVSEGMIRKLAHDLKNSYDSIKKLDITFEKPGSEDLSTSSDDEDDMVAMSILDTENMAEQMYQSLQDT
ncbi:uncharacterized protein PRCAT00004768001 [Priceomyces carsonii]|uniref:uncharacterized protein n=1 Tax=Priceomyces carsonii TaxID=28549 RepID=UPI002ED7E02A|nr:unnamed protein product [Priceomyces carsonii]